MIPSDSAFRSKPYSYEGAHLCKHHKIKRSVRKRTAMNDTLVIISLSEDDSCVICGETVYDVNIITSLFSEF
jgi:hypothetical protein